MIPFYAVLPWFSLMCILSYCSIEIIHIVEAKVTCLQCINGDKVAKSQAKGGGLLQISQSLGLTAISRL
jgi:hypothetical protein